MTKEQPVLTLSHVTTSFQTAHGLLPAVDDVGFSVFPREIVAVVGESGSGKTVTCLSVIGLAGASAVTTGSIVFDGRELVGLPSDELRQVRGGEIGFVFQEPMTSLNPVFTVGNQLDETLRAHTKLSKEQRKQRIIHLFELCGIPEPEQRMRCYPYELSGGMKQRVMIAMALCCDPKILIADEPTTALDVTIQAQVLGLLRTLRDQLGMSIVIVTHDLGVVANFAERVVVMYAGKIVEEGPTREVLDHPRHCYTRGLIASIPRLTTQRGQDLPVIPGIVPDLTKMPGVCRSAPPCGAAADRCKQQPPEIVVGPGHRASCWLEEQKEGTAYGAD